MLLVGVNENSRVKVQKASWNLLYSYLMCDLFACVLWSPPALRLGTVRNDAMCMVECWLSKKLCGKGKGMAEALTTKRNKKKKEKPPLNKWHSGCGGAFSLVSLHYKDVLCLAGLLSFLQQGLRTYEQAQPKIQVAISSSGHYNMQMWVCWLPLTVPGHRFLHFSQCFHIIFRF